MRTGDMTLGTMSYLDPHRGYREPDPEECEPEVEDEDDQPQEEPE